MNARRLPEWWKRNLLGNGMLVQLSNSAHHCQCAKLLKDTVAMTKKVKSGKLLEDGKTEDPIWTSTNPSLNSEIHATTAINSSVKPEDYPKADRDEQVRAATGRPTKKR